MIAITRADPALGLPRWRARGELAELRASELAFTTAEARELLVDRGGLRLDDEQIEVLRNRTEGWPAAMYLAALWLRTVKDLDRAVLEFGGEHRYVAEYLSHEVLAALDTDHRSLLLRVAVLGGFTAELCDEVLGRTDSAARLAELEESNMFVQSLERGEWFRVHPLFAEFAAAQLASEDPGAAIEIHRRAAESLRSRGLYVEAAAHASAAGDHEVVAEILSINHLGLLRNGRASTLLHWTRTLPDDCLVAHPELAGAAATAATMLGHLTLERRRLVGLASRARDERPERFGVYADAVLEMVRAAGIDGGVSEAVRDGRRAAELVDSGADEVFVAAHAALAGALYFAGELDEAWGAARRAVEHPTRRSEPPDMPWPRRRWLWSQPIAAGSRLLEATPSRRARSLAGSTAAGRWLGANTAVATGVCWPARATSRAPSASSPSPNSSSETRSRRSITHTCWSGSPRFAAGVAASMMRMPRCGRPRMAIAEITDSGIVSEMAAGVAKELTRAREQASDGRMLETPTEAELAVLQMLPTDLSAREIGAELFLSANTVRSHTRSIYRKLAVTRVKRPLLAQPHWACWTRHTHPGDGARSEAGPTEARAGAICLITSLRQGLSAKEACCPHHDGAQARRSRSRSRPLRARSAPSPTTAPLRQARCLPRSRSVRP